MRINRFVASATGLSRRAADDVIRAGRLKINQTTAKLGDDISPSDTVWLDDKVLTPLKSVTLMLNKPPGYVCSRNGQGSATIYQLLPPDYQHLKTAGRLDKDSSGLLLLTSDGQLAQQLTHPANTKIKIYDIELDQPLQPAHQQLINDSGVQLDDGPSQLDLAPLDSNRQRWQISMHQGRNRQIRRTFAALGYNVTGLHRRQFGPYQLGNLASGQFELL